MDSSLETSKQIDSKETEFKRQQFYLACCDFACLNLLVSHYSDDVTFKDAQTIRKAVEEAARLCGDGVTFTACADDSDEHRIAKSCKEIQKGKGLLRLKGIKPVTLKTKSIHVCAIDRHNMKAIIKAWRMRHFSESVRFALRLMAHRNGASLELVLGKEAS